MCSVLLQEEHANTVLNLTSQQDQIIREKFTKRLKGTGNDCSHKRQRTPEHKISNDFEVIIFMLIFNMKKVIVSKMLPCLWLPLGRRPFFPNYDDVEEKKANLLYRKPISNLSYIPSSSDEDYEELIKKSKRVSNTSILKL